MALRRFTLKRLFISLLVSISSLSLLEGAITFHNGQVWDADDLASLTAEEHYRLGTVAFERKDWYEAAKQFNVVSLNFPNLPLGHRATFFLGVSFFHVGEFEFANKAFNEYLSSCQGHPEYFEDAICYKFEIAEAFRAGEKRHLFGMRKMPRWLSCEKLCRDTYDEVILAAPSHEAAIQSLYCKAYHHWNLREYSDAITCLETLTKRFPKHELAPESYLSMNKIYMDWSRSEFQNPDILAMAEINQTKFETAFPGEERLDEGRADILAIKESYAVGLYETAQFYERVSQPQASVIYYRKAVSQFPETQIAKKCYHRLLALSGPGEGVCAPGAG